MKQFTRLVLVGGAAAVASTAAIAILGAAHMPFPPALSGEAWAQWAVQASLVYTCMSLCMFILSRIFGESIAGVRAVAQSKA